MCTLFLTVSIVHDHYRDEFSESQTAGASRTSTASGMNPYSSYYGATEHASRDSNRDEQSRREWTEDSNQVY